MKTRIFLLVVLFVSLFVKEAKAQYQFVPEPTPNMYDTLYVFDTTYIVNSFMTSDSVGLYIDDPNISTVWQLEQRPYSLAF